MEEGEICRDKKRKFRKEGRKEKIKIGENDTQDEGEGEKRRKEAEEILPTEGRKGRRKSRREKNIRRGTNYQTETGNGKIQKKKTHNSSSFSHFPKLLTNTAPPEKMAFGA